LFQSREWTNFTYDLQPTNLEHLAALLSMVTKATHAEVLGYMQELLHDDDLQAHVSNTTLKSRFRTEADLPARFGRRLGWYALVRATKPQTVIETGVDKGLGAVVLCAALLRNASEGHPGRYLGTDINPHAGYLLKGPYATVGKILVGDSLASLKTLDTPIDFFINDSDHSADYEYREYLAIAGKLRDSAIIVGDNAHVSESLLRFSIESRRSFLFWKEQPLHHWYPGAGIGISWRPS
jgi:predicted O-methyltransferase YrrM